MVALEARLRGDQARTNKSLGYSASVDSLFTHARLLVLNLYILASLSTSVKAFIRRN